MTFCLCDELCVCVKPLVANMFSKMGTFLGWALRRRLDGPDRNRGQFQRSSCRIRPPLADSSADGRPPFPACPMAHLKDCKVNPDPKIRRRTGSVLPNRPSRVGPERDRDIPNGIPIPKIGNPEIQRSGFIGIGTLSRKNLNPAIPSFKSSGIPIPKFVSGSGFVLP